MSNGSWFVVLITVLDVLASAFYAYDRKWYDAAVWLCFALANVALVLKTELGQ